MDANPMQCNLVLGFSSSAFLVSSSLSCLLCVKKRFIFLFFQPGSKPVSSYSHSVIIVILRIDASILLQDPCAALPHFSISTALLVVVT
jgi:hypothetical protein